MTFSIDGLPERVRSEALGVDSLQAIVLALEAIYWLLKPHRSRLAWFDRTGETGVPYIITAVLPGEEQRLERIVQAEEERSAAEYHANHPATEWERRVRERYDPDYRSADYAARSSAELVDMLRDAARLAAESNRADNTDAWFALDENVDPEAAEARGFLKRSAREAARSKPWDAVSSSLE